MLRGRGAPPRTSRPAGIQVAELQRARIIAAAMEIISELGYNEMSVARVTGLAGVSRKTFYELFDDREDCFLHAFDEAVGRIAGVARPAYEHEGRWQEKVRAGVSAVLQFIGDEPGLGTLLIVEALGAGPRVLERRARWLATLSQIVDQGRSEATAGRGSLIALRSVYTAEGIVGAVLSVLHARLVEHRDQPLIELCNPLMSLIVLPYLGPTTAKKELARPIPNPQFELPRPLRYPLDDLGIRITYRTLRVLAAIAALSGQGRPDPSNREIADHAGISDPGQISKLLARLEKHELVHNSGDDQSKGERNAWTLTTKGEEVERATRAREGG
ncbi:MAG TPA: TetR family transcriptional regulator [Solirubrobacteraceae bacterium]